MPQQPNSKYNLIFGSNFNGDHPGNIPVKLFKNLTRCFREEDLNECQRLSYQYRSL